MVRHPPPLPNSFQIAAILAWFMGLAALLAYLSSCSSNSVQLPARDVGRALCALEVVEQLPPDPKRVDIADVENVVREYKACLSVPDGGAP